MEEGYTMFVDDDDIERDHVIETGVSWSAFEDVFLAKEDFRLLTAYQKAPLDQRRNMLIEFGKELARIFCVLLEKFSSQQDLKYILTLLNEIFRSEFGTWQDTMRILGFHLFCIPSYLRSLFIIIICIAFLTISQQDVQPVRGAHGGESNDRRIVKAAIRTHLLV
jgi:hypothetical protein